MRFLDRIANHLYVTGCLHAYGFPAWRSFVWGFHLEHWLDRSLSED